MGRVVIPDLVFLLGPLSTWRNRTGFKPIYTAGFCIAPFALLAEQINAQRHKSELPSGWRYFIRSPVSQVYGISGNKKAHHLASFLNIGENPWGLQTISLLGIFNLVRHKSLQETNTFPYSNLYGGFMTLVQPTYTSITITEICHIAVYRSIPIRFLIDFHANGWNDDHN